MKSNWHFKHDLYIVTQLTYQLTCRLWPGWKWECDMVIWGEDGDDALLQNRTNHSRQRTAMKSDQTEFEGPVAFPYVLPLRVTRRVLSVFISIFSCLWPSSVHAYSSLVWLAFTCLEENGVTLNPPGFIDLHFNQMISLYGRWLIQLLLATNVLNGNLIKHLFKVEKLRNTTKKCYLLHSKSSPIFVLHCSFTGLTLITNKIDVRAETSGIPRSVNS